MPGESIRVFPLSNWTELDVWEYIMPENIPVVPLYFAKQRPVVWRDGTLIMVDDERMPLAAGETAEMRSVRFRTLGLLSADRRHRIRRRPRSKNHRGNGSCTCCPSGKAASSIATRSASMEKKKQEGYF